MYYLLISLASLVLAVAAFFAGRALGANRYLASKEAAESALETARGELSELQTALVEIREANAAERATREAVEKQHLEFKKEMEGNFKAISQNVMSESQQRFLELAADKFKDQTAANEQQLAEKEKLIQKSLEGMDLRLKDIVKHSTELKTELSSSKEETGRLRDTAEGLKLLLASSQKRGQWGERMVEDILAYIGLVEHVNYEKQQQVESGERPDYTFKLPKERIINMDVKFPIDHYERFLHAEDKQIQDQEKKAFLSDVRKHLKTISKREYIDPANGTVDYAMMFIPNEAVYGFINAEDPDLISEALTRKIMLCSPVTLYAVLSLLRQATANFVVEQQATEIMNEVAKFQRQWEMFTEVMDKSENALRSAVKHFDTLVNQRSRLLEKPIDNIRQLQQASHLENPTLEDGGDDQQ